MHSSETAASASPLAGALLGTAGGRGEVRASRPGPKHMLVCLDAALPGIKSFSGSHLHASMNAGILSRSPPRYSISSTCLKWLASLDVLVARVNPGPQIAKRILVPLFLLPLPALNQGLVN